MSLDMAHSPHCFDSGAGGTASFTNNFHAPALGAAIVGEPEQDHVFQTSARPLRKQAWPNRSEPRKSHPSRGGPEGLPSAQAQGAWQ